MFKNQIKTILREEVDKLIRCKSCNWSWKKSEGGSDMYFCHKCGNDNTPSNINEEIKMNEAAGVLIKCEKTNNLFMLLRNDKTPSWSMVSGGLEKGEGVIEGLKREIKEELSIDPNIISLKFMYNETSPKNNLIFHYFQGLTSEEFTPKLDNENLDWGWFSKNNLPSPLYYKMQEKIDKL